MKKYTLSISFQEKHEQGIILVWPLNDDQCFNGDIQAPLPAELSTLAIQDRVEMLREKRFRRDAIVSIAAKLAVQLCNRLEDQEGWNGERRREAAERARP